MDRFDVPLDGEHAALLRLHAERAHVEPNVLAGAMLASAIEDAALPDPHRVTAVLNSIPGARERTFANLAHARADLENNTVPIDAI